MKILYVFFIKKYKNSNVFQKTSPDTAEIST